MPVVDGEPGRAFDLRDRALGADGVVAAIAGEDAPVAVDCAAPGPVHERVGVVEPGRTYPLRAALAAAGRERGLRASQDEALATVRDRLAALDLPAVSLAEERRTVAETDDATALEAQVATLRGQLEAARERGDDPEALAAARERAVADLAERRTERIAAEQSLERARSTAQAARDRREEHLQLEDRERNLEREARRELAGAMASAFERALTALPTDPSAADVSTADAPWRVDGPDAIGALAVCRIAPIRAPVVLAGEWFDAATAATAALDAPVILVDE